LRSKLAFRSDVLTCVTVVDQALLVYGVRLDETPRGKVMEQVENGVNPSCHSGLYGTKSM